MPGLVEPEQASQEHTEERRSPYNGEDADHDTKGDGERQLAGRNPLRQQISEQGPDSSATRHYPLHSKLERRSTKAS